jgi:ABC-type polysaccharide/polyol phosphate transport system ATPase subunit
MHPNDGRVVSNFIVQALQNKPVTIYGTGSQTRSFCYVDDMIEGFIRLMNSPDDFTGPVNLGNPVEFTILELAEKILTLTGSRSEIVFKPLPENDPQQRKPDITMAMRELKWKPRVQLEEGLKKTISYFDNLLSGLATGETGTPFHYGNEKLKLSFGETMTTPVISVQGLGKKFRRNSAEGPFKIKHLFTGRIFKKRYESFWCLDDVTFEVAKGQMVGIIGPNGSGKSTLLRLIGGVGRPDKGSLEVNGRIGALLDLGAGFHNDLSGRDNIYISGVVAGLTRRQISERFDEIVAFADLESFLDNPLRTYSSGMRMRLAFAVATNIDPDILAHRRNFSVGDIDFSKQMPGKN